MNKKMIYAAILLSLIVQLIGCEKKEQETVKRIVIESDVRETELNLENINYKGTGEIVNFKLDKGEYFYPSFYHEGEIYGYISKGIGQRAKGGIHNSTAEPTREYLYKVGKNNTLIETSKEAIGSAGGHEKLLGFAYEKGDKAFSIDYRKEDKPREIPELTTIIKELKGESEKIYSMSECGDYVIIRESESYYAKGKIYFYDMKNKKLYEKKDEGDKSVKDFFYVDSLKSIISIDKNLKIYKLKFEDKYCHLEEYFNLSGKRYTDNVKAIMINSDEMIIFEEKNITDLKSWYNELISISKFNFKTNQYNILFEAPREVSMSIRAIKNNILIIEELKENDRDVIPIKRYLKKIEDNDLITLFEQKVEDDNWNTLLGDILEDRKIDHTCEWILISEDEKEMLFTKQSIILEKDMEKTKDIIYKKYKVR